MKSKEDKNRDRLYAEADFFGTPFLLIDTGGIHSGSKAPFNKEILQQAEIGIEEADALIFVVRNALAGATQLDEQVAKILHRTKKPVILAVNKIDSSSRRNAYHQFSAVWDFLDDGHLS